MIVDNPKNYLSCEVDYIINIWVLKLNKDIFDDINKDKIYEDISDKLL